MSGTSEQIGGGRVCDATTALFLQQKKRVFCSNVRFWTFSASICVGHLRRHFVGCDAGCAYLRKGEKRAVPRPILPMMAHPATNVTPGGGVMFRCDIWGNFTGKNAA